MKRATVISSLTVLVALGAVALIQSTDMLPTLASREGALIDGLLRVLLSVAGVIAALVVAILLYCIVAFRRQPGDLSDGTPIHGNTQLEALWTLVPLVIVIVLGVYGQVVWHQITRGAEGQPEMIVDVTAVQYAWQFHYPGFQVTTGELVLPRGTPVLFRLSSQDVIHSFWVREFRAKMDAVPGMVTELWITPSQLGQYEVWCAEVCGLAHGYMKAPVRVVESSDFDAWVATQRRR